MICILNTNTNPYFNLASEEYVMKYFAEDIFMLWRNEPAIIVGKFQNTLAEINIEYVKEKNIKVVRRMSGGGAVFHDLGNLNFTFIETNSKGNFQTFTEPILEVLRNLNVDARFEGRNDLTIDGKKISGNAQCVHQGRTLHHGTLLFSAEMTDLSKALKVNPLKYQDKAVKSVRKRVTNISEHLKKTMTVVDFANLIINHIKTKKENCTMYEFSATDIANIKQLQKEKYETWNWNFGISPNYSFSKIKKTVGGTIEVYMTIEKSTIKNIRFYGDFFAKKDIADLELLLQNKPHQPETIELLIKNISIDDFMMNVSRADLLDLLF